MTPHLWGVFIGFLVGFVMMRVHRAQAARARDRGDGSRVALLNAVAALSTLIWACIGWLAVPYLIPDAP
ncbi:MAG: hypothetical protein R3D57_19940 [Hyphomicrobiaceae bacterium]